MSRGDAGTRARRLSLHLNGGGSRLVREPYQPGDEVVGEYTRKKLMRMDSRFVAAMERAFRRGHESRESASSSVRAGAGDRDRLSLAG